MATKLLQASKETCSYIDVELSEHYKDAPALYVQSMLDASGSAVMVLDESGTILYANKAWQRLAVRNGLPQSPYGVGLNYLNIYKQVSGSPHEEAAAITDGITQILLGRELEFQKEYSCPGAKTQNRALIHAARFDLPTAFRILVTHDWVTSNKPAREAEEKDVDFRKLSPEPETLIWEADAESHRFTYVGESAANVFGYPLEQWYEPNFWISHIHPTDRERVVADCRKHSKMMDDYEIRYRMSGFDGRTIWLHEIVSVIRKDSHPKILRGFLSDITGRKRTEETLINLSGRLIHAQEEERKRIARELHDDLNQRMALLSIELEQLGQRIQKPRNLRPLIQSLQIKAREISTEIQRLSYRLHPSKLDHLGLAAAVQSLCEELSASREAKVEFRQTGFPTIIPKDVSLCVFRITQETLRNCFKHSGAYKIQVVLEKTEEAVRLAVSDDGCGFDTKSDAMKKGLGFTSMKERLRLVGGEMQIHSQPLAGTWVEISVPLTAEAETDPLGLPTDSRWKTLGH